MMPATDIREFCHQVREAARDAEHSESSAVGAMASRGVLCQCSVTAALRRYAIEQAPLQARLWHEDASARQEISPRQAADLQNFHAAMFWAIWIDYEVADAISACGPAEQVAARLDHFYGRLPLPILRHHLTGGRGCPSFMLSSGDPMFHPTDSQLRCWEREFKSPVLGWVHIEFGREIGECARHGFFERHGSVLGDRLALRR